MNSHPGGTNLNSMHVLDATDRRILTVLDADPRATVQAIAYRLGLARGTVHTRLDKLQTSGALRANSLRLDPPALGWPLRARITAEANQEELEGMIADLELIPEITECFAVSAERPCHRDRRPRRRRRLPRYAGDHEVPRRDPHVNSDHAPRTHRPQAAPAALAARAGARRRCPAHPRHPLSGGRGRPSRGTRQAPQARRAGAPPRRTGPGARRRPRRPG